MTDMLEDQSDIAEEDIDELYYEFMSSIDMISDLDHLGSQIDDLHQLHATLSSEGADASLATYVKAYDLELSTILGSPSNEHLATYLLPHEPYVQVVMEGIFADIGDKIAEWATRAWTAVGSLARSIKPFIDRSGVAVKNAKKNFSRGVDRMQLSGARFVRAHPYTTALILAAILVGAPMIIASTWPTVIPTTASAIGSWSMALANTIKKVVNPTVLLDVSGKATYRLKDIRVPKVIGKKVIDLDWTAMRFAAYLENYGRTLQSVFSNFSGTLMKGASFAFKVLRGAANAVDRKHIYTFIKSALKATWHLLRHILIPAILGITDTIRGVSKSAETKNFRNREGGLG